MTAAPTISVVMPVYNGALHVGEALDSVLAQTFDDFEVIAVDDGSRDDSWSILRRYASLDHRIKPHRLEKNSGHHVASNTAMARASGTYLAGLDQDDLATPARLARTVEAFEAHPDVGLVHSQYVRWLPDGTHLVREPPGTDTALRIRQMFGNTVCHSALALRASLLGQLSEWYRDLPGPQDYDLIVRALQVTRSLCIGEPLAIYRQSTMAMTEQFSDRMEGAVDEIAREQLRRFVPEEQIPAVRRVFGVAAEPGDWPAVEGVHRVLTMAPKLDPRVDPVEAAAIRRWWVRRALRATLSGRSDRMPRDARMLAALLRYEPVESARWVGDELRSAWNRRRSRKA